jgi:hypothetical protein
MSEQSDDVCSTLAESESTPTVGLFEKGRYPMEENAKREDLLSEELLESVMGGTGGTGGASSSGGAGRIADCPECSMKAGEFRYKMSASKDQERLVANPVAPRSPGQHKSLADKLYQQADRAYHQIKAHGHSDFPDALNPPTGH